MTALRFDPPGPGSWALDAAHCERPRSHYANDLFNHVAPDGFRAAFAEYGMLLDTIEFKSVGPFPYGSPRLVGAPAGSTGLPPKWVFKLMLAIHPAIRRRIKRGRQVMEGKLWRQDLARFWQKLPEAEAELAALVAEPIDTYSDEAFTEHVVRVGALGRRRVFEHFRHIPVSVLPVGDFLAHAVEWTGAAPSEALAALRGHSPASVAAGRALEEAATAIAGDPLAKALIDQRSESAESVLAGLRAMPGPVGQAIARLLDRYGDTILSGYDVSELRFVELPELVIKALRTRMSERASRNGAGMTGDEAAARLRARVPEVHRTRFDELLAEARQAYPLRDAQVNVDMWALGLVRRALLEAGKRLAARKAIAEADDVFDLAQDELVALLRREAGPSAETVAARATLRRESRIEDAPLVLGPEPGEPPPDSWLPPATARQMRAFGIYRKLMEDPTPVKDTTVVRGVGASKGRSTGRARLVRSPADFSKLTQGDILVAPTTTPTYNVILPLLAGIVTDRGGLLSHPAIVSREYGFPGIVGTRDATTRIPDGAIIELDGDAGTVTVVSV